MARHRFLAVVAAAMAAVVLAACTSKESPSVTVSGKTKQDTLNQVRELQAQVNQYGAQFREAVGGAAPNPGSVRVGPTPCPGKTSDVADDGSFYVSGGWQLNLDPARQISTIRAVRDAWQTKGYKIVLYEEFDNGTRARLEGEDSANGYSFSIISTNPPTAVGIRVLSTCVKPADGEFPGDSITIYQ